MMTKHEILSLYEDIANATGQMLAAAKTQDWRLLTELENTCAQHIQRLNNEERLTPLTGADLGKKIATIHKILADDREIRDLVQPWMTRLSSMLNNTGQAKKLSRTYGQNSGN